MTIKEGSLTIRVEEDLKVKFVAACKANDLSAAQVLRSAMRVYLRNNGHSAKSVYPDKE